MSSRVIASRFQVEHLIGQGGMGEVYRGVDTQTGEHVAIKSLKHEIVESDPGLVERFQREGEALRQLNHPHIVKMLATAEEDNHHYLIMEYVAGGSLADLLKETKQLPVTQVLEIALDLADALTRAHRLNIIHRDIKPANVLLAEDGSPRLTDFGIAHIVGSTRVTQTGALVGTYAYLSPEAFNGEELDSRADIWAFGVMLCEMLIGRQPFEEANPGAIMMAIMHKPAPDLQTLRPDVPVGLADLIYRMLEKDRNRRIPSVRLVGAELDGLIHGMVVDTSSIHISPPSGVGVFDTPIPTTDSAIPLHNLPAQTTPFIGREEELAEITRLLGDPGTRLITLLGPGGMGKTRLSLEAAQRVIDGSSAGTQRTVSLHQSFPDGVYFVPLAPLTSSEFIVPTIAESLNFSFFGADDTKMQLLDFLREKRLLLVMDNFEHLIEGAGLVAEMLQAAPGVKVLASSRERLRLTAETALEVQGMRFPEFVTPADVEHYASVQLFVQSARRVKLDFAIDDSTAECVTQIVRLVQGMPLGIELAAAWLEALSPQEIVKEIEKSFDFLETELRDVPERHRSIRAVFEYSWNLLNEDERNVFKRLSVFRGGFTREAAEAVTGASLRALTALVNKSLLRRTPMGRYEIHELLRQYAERRLEESLTERDETHDQHSAYYANFLSKIESELLSRNQKKALENVESELENVRSAWQWAVKHGKYEHLEIALGALDNVYDTMSLFREGEATFRQAAEELVRQGVLTEDLLLWRIRLRQSSMGGRLGDFKHNHEQAQTSLLVFKHWHAKAEIALTYRNLGYTAMMLGDYAESRQYGELGVEVSQELNDPWMLVMNKMNLGYVIYLSGEYEKSRDIYRECMSQADANGIPFAMAYSRNNLGEILHAMGEEREAKALFEEGYALFKEIGNRRGMAFTVNNLGNVAHAMGDYEGARRYNQQSYDLVHEIGDRRGMADALNRLGGVAYSLGEFQQAEQYHQKALAISREIGERRGMANALIQSGQALSAYGKYDAAEAVYKQALAIRQEMGNPSEIADALQLVGLIKTLNGNYDEAPSWLDDAIAVLEKAGVRDPILSGRDRAFRAVNHLFAGWFQKAKEAYQNSLPELEARGIKWAVLQGHIIIAWAEFGLGNLAEAREHGQKSLRVAVEIRALDWAAFCITVLANVLAVEGQTERAVEILSFVNGLANLQHFMRVWAARSLDDIRQWIPSDRLDAAVARSKTLQFDAVVADLLA
jgi:serine/threonine protein kinase/tetratricopeptide (TPR) repeat protein